MFLKEEEMATKQTRERVRKMISSPSRVEQSHKKRCNINTIMAKVKKGQMVPVRKGTPLYGDFSSGADFMDCQNAVIEVNEQFMSLPAVIRRRFNHNARELIDFLADPENEMEAKELGLLEKEDLQDAPGSNSVPKVEEPSPETEKEEEKGA